MFLLKFSFFFLSFWQGDLRVLGKNKSSSRQKVPIKLLYHSWVGVHWQTPRREQMKTCFSSTEHPGNPWGGRRMPYSAQPKPRHWPPFHPKAFSAAAHLRWIPSEASQMATPSVISLPEQAQVYLWELEMSSTVKSADKMTWSCREAGSLVKSSWSN